MKINYKYSRNNAQFLYDLSCASNIDQLIRRLTGHQIVTNDNNEKEHVDPAFNVDEILINSVEVFNRAEHETVYNDIDELCAPWDGTENKKLSEEDAKRRNAELTKAASLLKAYNDRFVELDKYLSLLPAEVRNIPNEFMSIGVNGFYRTVSISLGLDKYLDEISTDETKFFNTTEEQSQALTNVMNVINFLSELDKSAKELFNSDSTKEKPVNEGQLETSAGDQHETDEGQLETSTDDQHEADESQPEVSTDGQHETDEGQLETSTSDQHETDEDQPEASTDDQHEADESQPEVSTDDQHETDEGQLEAPTGNTEEAPTGDQHETDEGHKEAPTGNTEEAPTSNHQETSIGDQHETDEGHEDTPTGNTKDEPTGNQHAANEGQQDVLDGVAAVDAQLFPDLNYFLGSND